MSMQSVVTPAFTFTPPKRNTLTENPRNRGRADIRKTLPALAHPKKHIGPEAGR